MADNEAQPSTSDRNRIADFWQQEELGISGMRILTT